MNAEPAKLPCVNLPVSQFIIYISFFLWLLYSSWILLVFFYTTRILIVLPSPQILKKYSSFLNENKKIGKIR